MPSIRENILANVKTTLQAIAPSGVAAAGYSTPVKQVFRWGMDAAQIIEFPVLVFGDLNEVYTQNSLQLLHRTLTVVVEGYHKVEFQSDDAVAQAATAFLADIEKSLLADVTRGGNAVDTIFKSNEVFVESAGSPFVFVSLTAEIKYRTRLTDPASLTP